MKGNPLKEKLSMGEPAFGAAISVPCMDVAEALASLGFDWLFIDMEHAPLGFRDVQNILQAVEHTGATPVVRVPWNDPVYVKRVLDLGVYNVIIPWVNSREEAEAAVRACRYPPRGIRGCGPRRASLYGLKMREYLESADSEVMVIVQVETVKAVKNLKDILSVEGVGATLVGPADLSASLGFLGQLDRPEVKETIRKIAEAHAGTGVIPGIATSPSGAVEYLEMGFRLLSVGGDIGFMIDSGRRVLEKLKSLKKKL